MQFTNFGINTAPLTRLLAIATIAALLNACAGAAKKDDASDSLAEASSTETAPADGSAVTEIEVPFVPIEKPIASPVNVPQIAREEFALAKQAITKGDWKDAESRLILMTETYPQLAGVYVNLGIVYQNMEKFDDAERAYQFALEKNALNFDAYTNLGVVQREQGKFAEAESTYLKALEKWPHHQASLINLGILYDMYLGRLPEALAQFELAQKLNDEEDRKLKGWIVDLQRRMPK